VTSPRILSTFTKFHCTLYSLLTEIFKFGDSLQYVDRYLTQLTRRFFGKQLRIEIKEKMLLQQNTLNCTTSVYEVPTLRLYNKTFRTLFTGIGPTYT
jgi:hypothetical protein